MNHFYITHFAGCAVLFNKDTFHSDIKVNSVYIHHTRSGQQQVVNEGQSGWVLQAVISRAFFWRIPRNGKSYVTMMSLYILTTNMPRSVEWAETCYLQSVL